MPANSDTDMHAAAVHTNMSAAMHTNMHVNVRSAARYVPPYHRAQRDRPWPP